MDISLDAGVQQNWAVRVGLENDYKGHPVLVVRLVLGNPYFYYYI